MCRLAEYREELGISRQALADEVGCSKETVRLLELGDNAPNLRLAYAIAKALKKDVKDIWDPESLEKPHREEGP